MSMYNLVCGVNPLAPLLLSMAGLFKDERLLVPRIRDCWVSADLATVSVYARIGGGNRIDYREAIDGLRALPNYIRDADFERDNTYAIFEFTMPPDKIDELRSSLPDNAAGAVMKVITETAAEKWMKALEALDHGTRSVRRDG